MRSNVPDEDDDTADEYVDATLLSLQAYDNAKKEQAALAKAQQQQQNVNANNQQQHSSNNSKSHLDSYPTIAGSDDDTLFDIDSGGDLFNDDATEEVKSG